ncbi:MAG: hisS [Chlamydiales bacterium]|jgi:histidyl-tRNA synthetase|nr:hisS [Chlamydiales bacterium]
MADLQPPKGTFDIIPRNPDPTEAWRNSDRWHYVEGIIRQLTRDYGYHEIRTPIFEATELFVKNTGESSDIVTKEMYTFTDRGNRSMTLRPEGTPAVARSFINHQLQQHAPVNKFYYIAPMFRYDRPQAGRYRQHHQFGTEVIGNSTAEQDVEVIDMLYTFYSRLGMKGVKVCINSLGTAANRLTFREALKDFLRPHINDLSTDSQNRFELNPLRILDSKEEKDKALLKGAPVLQDFFDDESKGRFENVCSLLMRLGIPYEINNHLVRGLDYYSHTVFEMMTTDVGAQSSLGGGGRYDGLLKSMGGPDLPAVGFGCGLERVIRTLQQQEVNFPAAPKPLLFIVPLGEQATQYAFQVAKQMRDKHIPVEVELGQRKLKAALRYAEVLDATYTLVLGDEELQKQKAELKTMAARTSESIDLPSLVAYFEQLKDK